MNQVDVTPDLKNAHVYVSVLGRRRKLINATRSASGRLQSALAKHVVLKYTPHLVFHLDDSIERGAVYLGFMQQIDRRENKRERVRRQISEIGRSSANRHVCCA